MAMLQLLNDLDQSGFEVRFSLHRGLTITIRKRAVSPRIEDDAFDHTLYAHE
jgi:hypothetical protein